MKKTDIDLIKASYPLGPTIEQITGKQVVRHKICCPFHGDDTPSLHVYDDDRWMCYGCGLHGDVLSFFGYFFFGASYDQSAHFVDVISRIDSLGVRPLSFEDGVRLKEKNEQARRKEYVLPSERLLMQMHKALLKSPDLVSVLGDRGISLESVIKYKLGYGYVPKTSLEKPRFSIPFYNRDGRAVTAKFRRHLGAESEPKYLSYYGTTPFLYNVPAVNESDTLIYCGGQFDAIILEQLGFHAIGPSSETMFRKEWTQFFEEKNTLVLLDNDDAGHLWTKKVCEVIPGATPISW